MAGPRFSAPRSSSPICAFPANPFLRRREGARVVKTPWRRGSLQALLPAFQDLCWFVILRKRSWGAGRTPHWHPGEPWSLQTHEGGRCPLQEESGLHPSTVPLPQQGSRGGARLKDTPRGGVGPVQRLGSELHPGGGEQQVPPGGAGSDLAAVGRQETCSLWCTCPGEQWWQPGGESGAQGVQDMPHGGARIPGFRLRPRLSTGQVLGLGSQAAGLGGGPGAPSSPSGRGGGRKGASCPAVVLPAASLCGRCASHSWTAGDER